MPDLNFYPDDIFPWLTAVGEAVRGGVWSRYHVALGDPPYFLGEISKRFSSPTATAAKPGQDGSFHRLSRGFMGKQWDGFESVWHYQSWVAQWGRLLIEVLEPGALVCFFGGSRTWDLLTTGLRMAGFEIYPQILVWTYSQGSPVQHSVETAARKKLKTAQKEGDTTGIKKYAALLEQYTDYRNDLRPAFEPLVIARAPYGNLTYLERAERGSSAMNIGACRLDGDGNNRYPKNVIFLHHPDCKPGVCHTDCHVRHLDDQAGYRKGGSPVSGNEPSKPGGGVALGDYAERIPHSGYNDDGPVSRFYYCPKPSTWEKIAGLPDALDNTHPTIKSVTLCEWVARLLLPPKGVVPERRLLNLFAGTGTEMIGAHLAGWDVIDGVERDPEYIPIARARLHWWQRFNSYAMAENHYKNHDDSQMTLFEAAGVPL